MTLPPRKAPDVFEVNVHELAKEAGFISEDEEPPKVDEAEAGKDDGQDKGAAAADGAPAVEGGENVVPPPVRLLSPPLAAAKACASLTSSCPPSFTEEEAQAWAQRGPRSLWRLRRQRPLRRRCRDRSVRGAQSRELVLSSSLGTRPANAPIPHNSLARSLARSVTATSSRTARSRCSAGAAASRGPRTSPRCVIFSCSHASPRRRLTHQAACSLTRTASRSRTRRRGASRTRSSSDRTASPVRPPHWSRLPAPPH